MNHKPTSARILTKCNSEKLAKLLLRGSEKMNVMLSNPSRHKMFDMLSFEHVSCEICGPEFAGLFSAVSKPIFCKQILLGIAICSKRRLRRGTWKALAEIYTMHSFAPFSMLNFFQKSLKILPIFPPEVAKFDKFSLDFSQILFGRLK